MASPLLVRVKWRARSRVKWRARSWVQCLLGVCNYQIKKIEIRWLACFFGRIFSNGISFPCLLDSHVISNWLASLEGYFELYDISNERRVRFAIMKLI